MSKEKRKLVAIINWNGKFAAIERSNFYFIPSPAYFTGRVFSVSVAQIGRLVCRQDGHYYRTMDGLIRCLKRKGGKEVEA